MSEIFVMRRADGEPFTEDINGELVVPLWSTAEGLARYKERNPQLLTFFPARLTPTLLNKIRSGIAGAGTSGFLLLGDDDPDADLDEGKPISLEAITLENEPIPQPAQMQL